MHPLVTISIDPGNRRSSHPAAPDAVAAPSRSIRIPSCPATGHLRAWRSDVTPRRAILLHHGPASHGRGRFSFHPADLGAAAEPFDPPSGRTSATRRDISFQPARPGPAPGLVHSHRGGSMDRNDCDHAGGDEKRTIGNPPAIAARVHRLVTISIDPGNRRSSHPAAPDAVAAPSRSIRIPSCPATGHLRAWRSDVTPRRAILRHHGPASHGRGRFPFHAADLGAAAGPLTHHPAAQSATRRDISFQPARPGPRARAFFIPTAAGAWIVTTRITRAAHVFTIRPDAKAASRASDGYDLD